MNIFRKAPTIVLNSGALSSKVVVLGTLSKNKQVGFFRVCQYKDRKLHEYGESVTENDIGKPLVTIIFGKKDGVKQLVDGLNNLYSVMEG